MSEPHLAAILFQRLDDVRRRERAVLVSAGLFKTLLAVIVLVVAFFLLDWLIISRVADGGSSDRVVRAVLVIAMATTALVVLWRAVGRVLVRRLDDDAIALRVEGRHPALRGRLISTIQLTRSQDAGAWVGSEDLIKALEEDTVGFAQALDFKAIINSGTLRKAALAGTVFTLIAVLLGAWRSDFSLALFGRLLLGGTNYPTSTRIVSVTPGTTVPHGEPFTIEVVLDAHGVLPPSALLQSRGPSGTVRYPLLRVENTALYRCTIERVLESVEYRPVAGDARWPTWERLAVIQRPAVKGLEVAYRFPEYTGKAPATSAVADLQALEGTAVTLTATISKPLTRAVMRLRFPVKTATPATATAPGTKPVPPASETSDLPMQLSPDGLSASAALTIARDGWYSLVLLDRDGLENRDPSENLIAAIPDQAPTANLLFPAKDKTVTAKAAWPLRFEARDDFGLARGVVKYQITSVFADTGKQVESPVVEARIANFTAKTGTERVLGEVLFDLKPLNLKPDQRVTYWIEITDNRQPQANVGRSKAYAFTVAEDAVVREQLDHDRDDQLQRVEGIQQQQKDSRSGVDQIRSDLRSGDATVSPSNPAQQPPSSPEKKP